MRLHGCAWRALGRFVRGILFLASVGGTGCAVERALGADSGDLADYRAFRGSLAKEVADVRRAG